MKTIHILFILPLLAMLLQPLKAQDNPGRSSIIYLNGFGNAVTYALTYDSRFADKQNGWGGSVGLGGYALAGKYFLNLPVQVSYLFGEENHFFEIGGGVTFFSSNFRWIEMGNNSKNNYNLVGTLSFMYRLQLPKGFFLRTGWTPMFGQSQSNDFNDDYAGIHLKGRDYFGIQPGWMGIGLGYCIR
jgi:hypothetical protein